METAFAQQGKCISSPLRLWTHRTIPFPLGVSRVSIFVGNQQKYARSHRFRNMSSASNSDTLVAGRVEEENKRSKDVVSKRGDEYGNLKSWMHKNGLPPCKVVLKDRPCHDAKQSPIHYIAASEDLQAGDVAFSVPNSLVVTLERVLGNETVGKVL